MHFLFILQNKKHYMINKKKEKLNELEKKQQVAKVVLVQHI